MKKRKLNISLILGLTVVLLAACVVSSLGISYARYRLDKTAMTAITPREPEYVYLGTVARETEGSEGTFVPGTLGEWKSMDDRLELAFAVANGKDSENFAQSDQEFRVRLVGSMGVWDGEDTVDVILRVPAIPSEQDPEMPLEISGKAIRIQQDSLMYQEFGEGWVFCFYDAWGEEWRFDLKGGQWNRLELILSVNEVELTDLSLMQLQITGFFASK